jgi:DDE superfamily endonuclease
MHTWSEADRPLRLCEKRVAPGEPKALACYGLWLPLEEQMLLRFVAGRPLSGATTEFLDWVSREVHRAGKQALFLVWDNASWHDSAAVRTWLREHNRQVKAGAKTGVRLVICPLPKKAPWLNPIEPKWLHGKRAVAEPGATLDEIELMARVHEHFDCAAHALLSTGVS